MVSIGKLAVGQADYYLEQARGRVDRASSVGSGVEDYYVGGTEAPGYWVGLGRASVGVPGMVEREALVRVLDGQIRTRAGSSSRRMRDGCRVST